MKITKAYFDYIAISWACWECGLRNRTSITIDQVEDNPKVACSRCKSERKLKMETWPFLEQFYTWEEGESGDNVKKRESRLRNKSGEYARKWKREFDRKEKERKREAKKANNHSKIKSHAVKNRKSRKRSS